MPQKPPFAANVTYWDESSQRVDLTDTTAGGAAVSLFQALPVKAQATLLETLQHEHELAKGRAAAK